LAGFVLVQRGSQVSGDMDVWDMAEFFVLRGYRRRRVGASAAREAWRRLPGRWEVRVINANRPAVDFWRRVISEHVGRSVDSTRFIRNGAEWHLFAFDAGGAA
jgi:predicted acetyltransferase